MQLASILQVAHQFRSTKCCSWTKALEPEVVPTLEGNEFVGWFVGNDEYDFDTIVTDNLTITAKWNLLYVVTFNPNNDTLVFTRTVSANTPVLKPLNPGKQGHVFAGWYYLDENEEAQLWDFSTLSPKIWNSC